LDAIDDYIQIKHSQPISGETGETHISLVKYDTIKLMLEVLLDENENVDESLGGKSSDLSIPFKLSFNTLLNKKLLNKY
jgi:hypothetical protein